MAMILKRYEKQTTGAPMVIISTPDGSGAKLKSRLTKKHVLIAVVSLLITGLVVTGVLVGIRIFTDSNLEVLKQANGVKQNVSRENSVIYHVEDDTSDTWIVQNFDSGLQVSKITSDGKTACYVTALNRSGVTPPSSIPTTSRAVQKPDPPSSSVIYKVLPDQIPDISYLGKKASTMCENIPTYHAVPDCGRAMENNNANSAQNSTSITGHRSKREILPVPFPCGTEGGYTCKCVSSSKNCLRVCGTFKINATFKWKFSWPPKWPKWPELPKLPKLPDIDVDMDFKLSVTFTDEPCPEFTTTTVTTTTTRTPTTRDWTDDPIPTENSDTTDM